jgi:hypothetical protein
VGAIGKRTQKAEGSRLSSEERERERGQESGMEIRELQRQREKEER